jgi:hypothetical protein
MMFSSTGRFVPLAIASGFARWLRGYAPSRLSPTEIGFDPTRPPRGSSICVAPHRALPGPIKKGSGTNTLQRPRSMKHMKSIKSQHVYYYF